MGAKPYTDAAVGTQTLVNRRKPWDFFPRDVHVLVLGHRSLLSINVIPRWSEGVGSAFLRLVVFLACLALKICHVVPVFTQERLFVVILS